MPPRRVSPTTNPFAGGGPPALGGGRGLLHHPWRCSSVSRTSAAQSTARLRWYSCSSGRHAKSWSFKGASASPFAWGSRRGYRAWPGTALNTEPDVVKLLLVANGLVFLGWLCLPQRFMRENFVSTLRNLKELRVWTLVTPSFSHANPFHLLFNCVALSVMGPSVLQVLGPRRFLLLYLASGVASCVGHLVYVNEIRPRQSARNYAHYQRLKRFGAEMGAIGMSGSVMGISILFAVFNPTGVLLLWGVLPMRAPIMVAGFIAYDAYCAWTSPESATSHSGHLGGALYGLLYAYMIRRADLHRAHQDRQIHHCGHHHWRERLTLPR